MIRQKKTNPIKPPQSLQFQSLYNPVRAACKTLRERKSASGLDHSETKLLLNHLTQQVCYN